jgi:hypothetical protein
MIYRSSLDFDQELLSNRSNNHGRVLYYDPTADAYYDLTTRRYFNGEETTEILQHSGTSTKVRFDPRIPR